jgi:hypothetical protein
MNFTDYLDANYSTNWAVEFASQLTTKDFSADIEYLTQLEVVVVALLAVGVLAVGLFWFGLLFRCCCNCCRCLPSDDTNKPYNERWREYRLILEALFYCMVVFTLAFNIYIALGAGRLNGGMNTMHDALDAFDSIVGVIESDAELLVTYGDQLNVELSLAETSCSIVSAFDKKIRSSIDEYYSSVNQLVDISKSLKTYIHMSSRYMDYFAGGALFYTLFALVLLTVLLQVCCHFLQSYSGMKYSLACNNILYLLLLCLGAVWCGLSTSTGDFCLQPSHHLFTALPSHSKVRNVTAYYATCRGSCELQVSLHKGKLIVVTFDKYLTLLSSSPICVNDPNILDMHLTVHNINTALTALQNNTQCKDIHPLYTAFLYDGLCGDAAMGIFTIWSAQLFVSAGLLLSAVMACLLYQHYLPHKQSIVAMPEAEAEGREMRQGRTYINLDEQEDAEEEEDQSAVDDTEISRYIARV